MPMMPDDSIGMGRAGRERVSRLEMRERTSRWTSRCAIFLPASLSEKRVSKDQDQERRYLFTVVIVPTYRNEIKWVGRIIR